MDSEHLRALLQRDEDTLLEFKEEPYWIDHEDKSTKSRQRDELIKDILALANGNSIDAGETAYLIIGAGNKRNSDGYRDLYDVRDNFLSERRILDIVNNACAPALEDVLSELIEIDGKWLTAITIKPSPHLYETTRKLEPSTTRGSFTEYVVFVRHNESVKVASSKERDAITKVKRLRFNELRNPPAIPFGLAVGATIGGLSVAAFGEKITGRKEGKIVGGVVGALFGGGLGGLMGNAFKDVIEIRANWHKIPNERRLPAIIVSAVGGIGIAYLLLNLGKKTDRNR